MLALHRSVHSVAATSPELHTLLYKIPTNYSHYLPLLSSCKSLSSLFRIHARLIVLGMTHCNSIITHVINSYSSFQKCNSARLVFDSVPNPCVIVYNSMIRAYSRSGRHDEALKLYHVMLDGNLEPNKYTYTFVLKACAGKFDFQTGVRIHDDVVRRNLELDLYISTGLVDMYCKMGRLDDARKVFGKMPKTDIVSWNAMIAGLSEGGDPDEGLGVFRAMQLGGLVPNSVTLLNLFPSVCKLENFMLCRSIHGFITRRSFELKVYNGLIDTYSKCGFVEDARSVFDQLYSKDHVSWGTMMACYAHNGYFCQVLELFDELKGKSSVMNKISVVSSSLAASELRDLKKGKEIHNCAIQYCIDSDTMVATSLMTMYVKCGELDKANQLFRGLKEKDMIAWSALIAALVQSGFPKEAASLFREMVHEKLKPSSVTLMSILPACTELSSGELGKSIHCYCLRAGLDSEVAIGNALVSTYAKRGLFAQALIIFSRMPSKNVVSFNTLISGYSQSGNTYEVMTMFHELLSSGLRPDSETMVGVIPACALSQDLEHGTCIHGLIIKGGFASECHVKNALIDMYAKCSRLCLAETLFNEFDFIKDEVTWNAMISGYVHNRRSKEALSAFCQMKAVGLQPSAVSVVSVIPAAADLSALAEGMALHACTIRMGFQSNTYISNSLIDMYAKCGHFDCSEKYFDEMKNRDTITWNTMLAGYAVHGHATRAIELFVLMQGDNVKLDSVTFLSVLSACRHGGLVEEARKIFNSMHDKFNLKPKLEHYACMVDLLGRVGLFSEIMNLVNNMPLEPDAAVWGALLGACRMHSNSDLAEMALNKLVNLEPGNPAHYIGLSNIYAQSGRWIDARNMRLKQTDAGLKKFPGCSWV
ncbi:pentatricopeptide repeat-containing protein At2g39620 isoform X1 [Beta vulgaris subsp. vulgaris]|uniref:pentatricopeptide repeat-containing protein At2g39620 isoform X1 n=1 Tax=Beta vulgaris subsp. vulgaris TaxID=3555 RepID=UPI0020373BB0|nr:pentatricopeptide repeat-containing protein At2g39620 isoform X1 [Beta vulgaris subsp. vulgaris]XP_048494894.1 pentatricopeptide repeat-containing protein At2g39620 isoform X1 [Beta vulgaris subsp. vulgaris]XP_048494895.1 pentatricopeptide repeat-containing protein At2g39620 isoform X1 [Beta vulgaris subsp. vulgaris]XP_048494896.1 pentatricopeptide repeat-containing protein At2g39620 isoform X1 [Beta vulgaris subsp. vulgaris]XP_057248556.1 pentatricopeptide repeat-containing protein At2g3962